MKTRIIILSALAFIALAIGCKKDKDGYGSIGVRMHDKPLPFEAVNVEIIEVRLHHDGLGWIDLDTEGGIYNLLDFQNGVDTLIVPPQQVPDGHISQIRFILGDENTVVDEGVTYPLEMSSQDESGLKLNLHQDIVNDADYMIVVDFDAEQSIIINGDGTYKLKPVLTAHIE